MTLCNKLVCLLETEDLVYLLDPYISPKFFNVVSNIRLGKKCLITAITITYSINTKFLVQDVFNVGQGACTIKLLRLSSIPWHGKLVCFLLSVTFTLV